MTPYASAPIGLFRHGLIRGFHFFPVPILQAAFLERKGDGRYVRLLMPYKLSSRDFCWHFGYDLQEFEGWEFEGWEREGEVQGWEGQEEFEGREAQ